MDGEGAPCVTQHLLCALNTTRLCGRDTSNLSNGGSCGGPGQAWGRPGGGAVREGCPGEAPFKPSLSSAEGEKRIFRVEGPACARAWTWVGAALVLRCPRLGISLSGDETQAQRWAGSQSQGHQQVGRHLSRGSRLLGCSKYRLPPRPSPTVPPAGDALTSFHSSQLTGLPPPPGRTCQAWSGRRTFALTVHLPEVPFSLSWQTPTFVQIPIFLNPQESTLGPLDGGVSGLPLAQSLPTPWQHISQPCSASP